MNSGLSLYGNSPVFYYIALDEIPVKTVNEIQQTQTNDLTLETNRILSNNFRTVIILLVLGFVAMYFLLKKG